MAERIFRKINFEIGLANTYLQMGTFYSVGKEYEKGLKAYKRALELYEKNEDKEHKVRTINNIGAAYYNLKNYPDALFYYKKALEVGGGEIQPKLLGIIKNNIGLCHVDIQEYEVGIPTLLEANVIFKQLKDIKTISENTYWIASSYARYQDYPNARKYAFGGSRIIPKDSKYSYRQPNSQAFG